MPSPRFVSVALDIPLLPPLTYKVMDGTSPKIGDRCVVPIGNRSAVGLIVGVSNQTDIAEEKQKSYIRLLNERNLRRITINTPGEKWPLLPYRLFFAASPDLNTNSL